MPVVLCLHQTSRCAALVRIPSSNNWQYSAPEEAYPGPDARTRVEGGALQLCTTLEIGKPLAKSYGLPAVGRVILAKVASSVLRNYLYVRRPGHNFHEPRKSSHPRLFRFALAIAFKSQGFVKLERVDDLRSC